MKISARNVIEGTVADISTGPIMSNVKVDIGGGRVISAVITADAANALALAEGRRVYAIIKATEVMLATDAE